MLQAGTTERKKPDVFHFNNPPVISWYRYSFSKCRAAHGISILKAQKRQSPITGNWRNTSYQNDKRQLSGTIVPIQ